MWKQLIFFPAWFLLQHFSVCAILSAILFTTMFLCYAGEFSEDLVAESNFNLCDNFDECIVKCEFQHFNGDITY